MISCRRIVLLLLFLVMFACSQQEAENINFTIIRVGVLPDQNVAILEQRYSPLLSYLEKETGLKYELVIPGSYIDLLELFNTKEINMAYFGAVTFLKARSDSGAEPLVTRDVDNRFTSVILVSAESNAQKLEDIEDHSFSFGSRLSTSGHLMPRYFLEERNIKAEDHFREIHYSGAHDETVYSVQSGRVDAGAVNAVVVKTMLSDGRLKKGKTRILWESPPYQDYIWAIQRDMSAETRIAVRDAFLSLSKDVPVHRKVLAEIGANYFLPARIADFEKLQSIFDKISPITR